MSLEAKRKPLTDGERYRVLRRDNFQCQFCGAAAPAVRLEVDHLWPVSRGGTNDLWNLATACECCNSGKRAVAIDRFAARHELFRRYYEDLRKEPNLEMRECCEKLLWQIWGPLDIWLEPDLKTLRGIQPFLESITRGEEFTDERPH